MLFMANMLGMRRVLGGRGISACVRSVSSPVRVRKMAVVFGVLDVCVVALPVVALFALLMVVRVQSNLQVGQGELSPGAEARIFSRVISSPSATSFEGACRRISQCCRRNC